MKKPENSSIAKFLKGQSSSEEGENIKSWINESNKNKLEFEKLKTIWDSYEDRLISYRPNLDEAWNKIEQRTEGVSKFHIFPWFYRVAAVLILGFGITYFFPRQDKSTIAENQSESPIEILAQNEIRQIDLPDGTKITLNKGASISYGKDFGIEDRKVYLKGEAFFNVKRDESRRFIIWTNATTTQVLGTSFSINPTNESVVVTVVSGEVSFEGNSNNASVVLTKGEKGSYSRLNQVVSESVNDNANFLSWKTRRLLFEDAPISEVINDLEKHYAVAFEIDIKNKRRLTALFDDQSLEEVLEIISTTLEIKIEKRASGKYFVH